MCAPLHSPQLELSIPTAPGTPAHQLVQSRRPNLRGVFELTPDCPSLDSDACWHALIERQLTRTASARSPRPKQQQQYQQQQHHRRRPRTLTYPALPSLDTASAFSQKAASGSRAQSPLASRPASEPTCLGQPTLVSKGGAICLDPFRPRAAGADLPEKRDESKQPGIPSTLNPPKVP